MGKAFSDRLASQLRKGGFTVHEVAQREPKRARSLPHAGLARAVCSSCFKLIVPESAADMFKGQGLCRCARGLDPAYGRVDMLSAGWNDRAREVLHRFTGEPGGDDDLPDAMAIAVNAAAGGGGPVESGMFGPWG
jgi:hypothetical protein